MSEPKELMHYGPVWNKPRAVGDSFAACDNVPDHAILTTHAPWVTCPKCRELIGDKRRQP